MLLGHIGVVTIAIITAIGIVDTGGDVPMAPLGVVHSAAAKLDPSTLHRMESCGNKPVRGLASNVEAVLTVLKKLGVGLVDDPVGVRFVGKPKGRR